MERIYLSRRNLMILLSKLDRVKAGDASACTIIKFQNHDDAFTQTIDAVAVTALEDDVLYLGRGAGPMNEADEVNYASQHMKAHCEPDVYTRDAPAPDEEG